MLTATQVRQAERRRRPPPSLEQQYHEYVMQRVEAYKNSLSRDELLRLGDEAVAEMQASAEGQFVLTEVLMLDSVDALIAKRLRIRSYRRWRTQLLKLRQAQREPTHWGLESSNPLCALLGRLEPGDTALVVGGGADGCACLLAAHETAVTFLAADLGSVERVESRIASEALGTSFDAYVVQFGGWLPPLPAPLDLAVLDLGALGELETAVRLELLSTLQALTAPGGVHVLLAADGGVAPEALLSLYGGWGREASGMRKRRGRVGGVVLSRPPAEALEAREA
jgi:hypothetical protein